MTQKQIFLESEGNAWLARNKQAQASRVMPDSDRVLLRVLGLPLDVQGNKAWRVLEIGCGQGMRLAWMQQHLGFQCSGVDPSAEAVDLAKQVGIDARQGTAEQLPFDDGEFDLLIFGFCLYLCDRSDLFRIAAEADRVLKYPGWLIINDFYSKAHTKRDYHHRPGLLTHKMDYRTLFTWHPDYTCHAHEILHHVDRTYTDDPQEWVAVSLLRKNTDTSD